MLDVLQSMLQVGKWIDWNSHFASLGMRLPREKKSAHEVEVVTLPLRTINSAFSKCVVWKQNSTS